MNPHVPGDGQGPSEAMAEGDREGGGCKLCVRWMDSAECGASVYMSVG